MTWLGEMNSAGVVNLSVGLMAHPVMFFSVID